MIAKLLRDGIILVFGAFAAVVLALSFLVWLKSDRIVHAVTSAVNSSIDTRFTHRDFKLSIISTFPEVRARLKDVHLTGKDGLPFVHAENLDIRLDFRSALRSEIDIRSINIKGGTIYLIDKKDKGPNYDIFPSGPTDSGFKTGLNVLLRNLRLQDVLVVTDLETSGNRYKKYIPSMEVSGQLSGQLLQIDLQSSIVSDYIEIGDLILLENEETNLTGSLTYDFELQAFSFKDLDWRVRNLKGRIEGEVLIADNRWKLSGKIEPSPALEMLSILPLPAGFISKAEVTAGTISGTFSAASNPNHLKAGHLSVDAVLKNGGLRLADPKIKLESINGAIAFKQGSDGNSNLDFLNFTAISGSSDIALSGSLANFGKTSLDLISSGNIHLDWVSDWLPDDFIINTQKGKVKYSNLKMAGRLDDNNGFEIRELSGVFEMEECAFHLLEEPFFAKRGMLKIDSGGELHLSTLELSGLGCNILADGSTTIEDWREWSAGNYIPNQAVELKLNADKININNLLAFFEVIRKANSPETEVPADQRKEPVTPILSIQFYTDILQWDSAEVGQLSGYFYNRSGGGLFSAMGAHAGGHIDLDGHFTAGEESHLSLRLSADSVSVGSLFSQWQNFNQEFIQTHHLEGRLKGHMKAYFKWDSHGQFNRNASEVVAAIQLEQGRLTNFPMLQSFSGFVHDETLSNIVFDDLSNIIWMRDGAVFMPELFIRNNAINLTVSGAHSLNQDFRYGIRLNAGQVMTDRILRRNKNLNPLPSRKNGFFVLNILLEGNPENFTYRTSNAAVVSVFRQTNQMKQAALESLRKSFDYLPYFEMPTETNEIPEFHLPEELEEMEPVYIEGFGAGT